MYWGETQQLQSENALLDVYIKIADSLSHTERKDHQRPQHSVPGPGRGSLWRECLLSQGVAE